MTNARESPLFYSVSAPKKRAVLDFLIDSLRTCGCTIVHEPAPNMAPYRLVFDTPSGERLGIIAYAFFANSRPTKNRPPDEHRFQVKYGSKDRRVHTLWQDPYGLYTTLFLGVDPVAGVLVAADPVLHSPTRFFISIEFKRDDVEQIKKTSWHAWERDRRQAVSRAGDEPVEILVGGTRESFLRYVRFEREAYAEDQGHRQLLAEQILARDTATFLPVLNVQAISMPSDKRLHQLATEFELENDEILDLISRARRLKMAVRGWVAEEHLVRHLKRVPGVNDCRRLDEEGGPDVTLSFGGSAPLSVECKNVLRQVSGDQLPRLDFQRTRASKQDPCSRYYKRTDFDIVAACLHAVTQKWEYAFSLTRDMDPHTKCFGRLASNVKIDKRWRRQAADVLCSAVGVA